jgi:hypothetical protein
LSLLNSLSSTTSLPQSHCSMRRWLWA